MSNPPAVFPSSHSPPVIVTTGGENSGAGKAWLALAAGLLGAQLAILLAILVAFSNRNATEAPLAEPDTMRIREAVVDDLLSKIAAEGPEGATRSWRETALANEQLRAANLGLLSRVDSLATDLKADRHRLQQADQELATVGKRLAEAESRLASLAPAASAEAGMGFDWKAVLAGAAGGLVLGWLVCSLSARRPEWRQASAAPQGESAP